MTTVRLCALASLAVVVLASPASAQSATPTVTASPAPLCGQVAAQASERVAVGQPVDIKVTVTRPFSGPGGIHVRRINPKPVVVVRTQAADSWTTGTTFRVTLGQSHEFYVNADQHGCMVGEHSDTPVSVRIAVQPSVGIAAVRNAARDYSFSGRVLPARGQAVTLYRVTDTGSRVITARSTVRQDGTYRIDRRFTSSGRFGFEARVDASSFHLAGASAVRPTAIY